MSRTFTVHRGQRSGWLRAAVLGADDGIVSVASLAVGVIAAGGSRDAVLAAAVAALAAGALSMAVGEYVSVSSQRDTEMGDLRRERQEHLRDPEGEARELGAIYEARGLSSQLAGEVAAALMAGDAIAAHARDELGITVQGRARPVQAALSSGAAFLVGGVLPLIALVASPASIRTGMAIGSALLTLVLLGIAGATAGGAPKARAAVRVAVGGMIAIAVTAGVGQLFSALTG